MKKVGRGVSRGVSPPGAHDRGGYIGTPGLLRVRGSFFLGRRSAAERKRSGGTPAKKKRPEVIIIVRGFLRGPRRGARKPFVIVGIEMDVIDGIVFLDLIVA